MTLDRPSCYEPETPRSTPSCYEPETPGNLWFAGVCCHYLGGVSSDVAAEMGPSSLVTRLRRTRKCPLEEVTHLRRTRKGVKDKLLNPATAAAAADSDLREAEGALGHLAVFSTTAVACAPEELTFAHTPVSPTHRPSLAWSSPRRSLDYETVAPAAAANEEKEMDEEMVSEKMADTAAVASEEDEEMVATAAMASEEMAAAAMASEATEGTPEELTLVHTGSIDLGKADAPVSPMRQSLRPSLAWSSPHRSRRAYEEVEEAEDSWQAGPLATCGRAPLTADGKAAAQDGAEAMSADANCLDAEPGCWPSGSEALRLAWQAGPLAKWYAEPLCPVVPAPLTAEEKAAAQEGAEAMMKCAASETKLALPAAAAAAQHFAEAMVDCAAGVTKLAADANALCPFTRVTGPLAAALDLTDAETLIFAEDEVLLPAAEVGLTPLPVAHLLEADAYNDLAVTADIANGKPTDDVLILAAKALAEADTLRLNEDVAGVEEEMLQEQHVAEDVAMVEEETLKDEAPLWRKEEFGEAMALHLSVPTNSYKTWVKSDDRLEIVKRMPGSELKRRRIQLPPAVL